MSERIVTVRGRQVELVLEREGTRFSSDGHEVEVLAVRPDEADLRIDGRVVVVPFATDGTTVSFFLDGEAHTAELTEKGARAKARHRDHSMAAPMPGLALKILVKPGDVVSKGAPLIVLEAMKMEHQIVAPRDGTVAAVNCVEGELVQPGVDLVVFEEAAESK